MPRPEPRRTPQLLRSFSLRRQAPWLEGAQNAVHEETWEVAWCREGVFHGVVAGQRLYCCPEMYTVIAPGEVHRSWTQETEAEEIVIHFCRFGLQDLAARLGVSPRSGVFPATGQFREAVARVHAQRNGPRVTSTCAVDTELLEQILGAMEERAGSVAPRDASDARVMAVANRMRRDPAESIRVAAAAKDAGMSASHFARRFRELHGAPPIAYLVSLRVAAAKALMLRGGISLTDVAQRVGFESSSGLTQAFKRECGLTPSAWLRAPDNLSRNPNPTTPQPGRVYSAKHDRRRT